MHDKWLRWVALTTTILAVITAIFSMKASGFSTKVQILTTKENNQWGYFQSKSIKQHSLELQKDLFILEKSRDGNNSQFTEYLSKKTDEYQKDLDRYNKEKAEIKKSAEDTIKEEEKFKNKGASLGLGVMFLQISIMLSSVGALIKKQELWIIGLCFGLIGVFYGVIGLIK
ncbi:MAG: DUF4337 domain-containing protein [Candidatus Omnitrophica bacterium]|nr:DUF4337 domain-containing protein [Candidatus Omnitrophota bacterium]